MKNFYDDPPRWFLYGGKMVNELPTILIPPEDSAVEKFLDEKYICKGEIIMGVQNMKLYRLKE